MRDLHDRHLVFKGENRPKKIYLYFMYVMALKKCGETRREGRITEMERSRRVLASLNPLLRASMVSTLAAEFGHDLALIYEDQIQVAELLLDVSEVNVGIEIMVRV